MALKILGTNDNKFVSGSDSINKTAKNLFKPKKLKNTKFGNPMYIKTIRFLVFKAKIIFTQLK